VASSAAGGVGDWQEKTSIRIGAKEQIRFMVFGLYVK
jgi:hypothetical protein